MPLKVAPVFEMLVAVEVTTVGAARGSPLPSQVCNAFLCVVETQDGVAAAVLHDGGIRPPPVRPTFVLICDIQAATAAACPDHSDNW